MESVQIPGKRGVSGGQNGSAEERCWKHRWGQPPSGGGLSSSPCRTARHQALEGVDPVRPGQLQAASWADRWGIMCLCVCA